MGQNSVRPVGAKRKLPLPSYAKSMRVRKRDKPFAKGLLPFSFSPISL